MYVFPLLSDSVTKLAIFYYLMEDIIFETIDY